MEAGARGKLIPVLLDLAVQSRPEALNSLGHRRCFFLFSVKCLLPSLGHRNNQVSLLLSIHNTSLNLRAVPGYSPSTSFDGKNLGNTSLNKIAVVYLKMLIS